MPRMLLRITLSLCLAFLTRALPAAAMNDQKPGQDLPPKFEPQITENLDARKFPEALKAVAQYSEAVRACYPAPNVTDGQFQSEAEHVRVPCPFPDWTPLDPAHASRPTWLPAFNFDLMLLLTNPKNADSLTIVKSDISPLRDSPEAASPAGMERVLKAFAGLYARGLGVEQYRSFGNVGEFHVLSVELSGKAGNSVEMRLFAANDQAYAFVLSCAASEKAEMQAKLLAMLKSTDLNYKPSQKERIEAIRAKVTDREDVHQQLQDVRDMILCGEYNAAAVDLILLRLAIDKRLPQPLLVGDDLHDDGHGVIVTNPDPTLWKSVIHSADKRSLMTLEFKSSVDPHGIIVNAEDPVMLYGLGVEWMVREKSSEAERKKFLSNPLHTGFLGGAAVVEKDGFRTFRGMLAYEYILKPYTLNVKIKVIVVLRSQTLLTVALLVDPKDAAQHFTEYEALLDKALTLK